MFMFRLENRNIANILFTVLFANKRVWNYFHQQIVYILSQTNQKHFQHCCLSLIDLTCCTPKLNSMQQLNFHFHLCSTKSKTKKSLSHKMNSLVAHDQLANLNFGKLRINSKILMYLSFAGIFSQYMENWIKLIAACLCVCCKHQYVLKRCAFYVWHLGKLHWIAMGHRYLLESVIWITFMRPRKRRTKDTLDPH